MLVLSGAGVAFAEPDHSTDLKLGYVKVPWKQLHELKTPPSAAVCEALVSCEAKGAHREALIVLRSVPSQRKDELAGLDIPLPAPRIDCRVSPLPKTSKE